MLLRRQTEYGHTFCARLDRVDSTNSAVGDAAQDVLHLARSQLCVNGSDGREAAEGMVGMLEPAHGTLMVTQVFMSNGYNASQSVKPVRFITCQPSTATTALQASRRKVKCAGKLFQSQARGSHQLFHDRRRKTVPDRLTHFTIARKRATEGSFAPQFRQNGPQFVYHYVAYHSDKWRSLSTRLNDPLKSTFVKVPRPGDEPGSQPLSFAADEDNPLAVRGKRRLAAGNAVPVAKVDRSITPPLHINIAELDGGASRSLLFVLLRVHARVTVVSLPAGEVSEHDLILVGERIMGYTKERARLNGKEGGAWKVLGILRDHQQFVRIVAAKSYQFAHTREVVEFDWRIAIHRNAIKVAASERENVFALGIEDRRIVFSAAGDALGHRFLHDRYPPDIAACHSIFTAQGRRSCRDSGYAKQFRPEGFGFLL